MVDVVIPFIHGEWDSIELRLVLRSIERHLQGESKIWIIGQKPLWIQNINHVSIEKAERPKFGKFFDQNRKIFEACDIQDIGARFIYTYDDVYFLRDINLELLRKPRAISNTARDVSWLRNNDAGQHWKDCMMQTIRALKKENLPLYNYETHLPRVYNKFKAKAILEKYNHRGFAFQFATMYFNNYVTDPLLLKDDPLYKLSAGKVIPVEELQARAESHKLLNANIFRIEVIKWLKERLNGKSKYEKY